MRIGIDSRYLSHGIVGGVHAYVSYLIPALIEADPNLELYLYADTKQPFEIENLPDNVVVRFLPYRNGLSSIYHDWVGVRRAMDADHIDVAHFPANYGFAPRNARTIITLHDHVNALPLYEIIRGHRKNLKTMVMMTYLHLCSLRAVRQAKLIVTVSQFSRDQILKYIDFDPEHIIAWMNGPSPEIQRITDEARLLDVRQRFELQKPFVIADGIKNPATLVDAWKLLPADLRDQYQIVFFSRTPEPPQPVREAVEAGYARLFVRPSDQDLRALYSMARALAFPSWYEGLGLPLLEAMICGAPVVASDRGAIPEVVGDAGLMCDVDDIKTFARNLQTVLGDAAEHERLQQRGFEHAKQFAWENTARAYLDIYERASRM